MKNFLVASVLLLAACSSPPVQNQTGSVAVDSLTIIKETTLRKPVSTVLDTVQSQSTSRLLQGDSAMIAAAMLKNTPKGFSIFDTMTGDLNRDKYMDLLMVLKNDDDSLATDVPRPLLILIGSGNGEMKLAAQNDSVLLCKECGGVFGDPYDGLAIKNGYFSVQHYGGSAWRWTKIITFKYNEEQKTWLLHRDGGVTYYIYDEAEMEPEEEFTNQEHYGKQKFTDYTAY